MKRQTAGEYLKERLGEGMYTYLIIKEDFYTGEQSGRKKTITKGNPLDVGGLYMHLGKGYPGSWRVLEEVENEEEI